MSVGEGEEVEFTESSCGPAAAFGAASLICLGWLRWRPPARKVIMKTHVMRPVIMAVSRKRGRTSAMLRPGRRKMACTEGDNKTAKEVIKTSESAAMVHGPGKATSLGCEKNSYPKSRFQSRRITRSGQIRSGKPRDGMDKPCAPDLSWVSGGPCHRSPQVTPS